MTEYLSHSAKDTEELGEALAKSLLENGKPSAFIALYGDMGVGKTAFVRGFAHAFGIMHVKSPTYTIVNEYKSNTASLFHFDMYRIQDEDDLYSVGYEDYLMRDGFIITEWSEKIPEAIPSFAVRVEIQKTLEENERRIRIYKETPC